VPTVEKRQERHARKIKLSFVLMSLLFVLVLSGFAWLLLDIRDVSTRTQHLAQKTAKLSTTTAHLTLENTKRIAEIQASRNFSCKQTYRGVRKVFKPFFTKSPPAIVRKFNRTVNKLIAGCESQVKPKPKKKG
jgi:hypothetical protein